MKYSHKSCNMYTRKCTKIEKKRCNFKCVFLGGCTSPKITKINGISEKKFIRPFSLKIFSKNIEFRLRGKHTEQLHHPVTLQFFSKYFYLGKSDLTNFLHFFVYSIRQNLFGEIRAKIFIYLLTIFDYISDIQYLRR